MGGSELNTITRKQNDVSGAAMGGSILGFQLDRGNINTMDRLMGAGQGIRYNFSLYRETAVLK
jgi:hypothetical protein